MEAYCPICDSIREKSIFCNTCNNKLLFFSKINDYLVLDKKYKFERFLVRGSKGIVLLFSHLVTSKLFAIKYLYYISNNFDVSYFINEAKLLGKISSKNIINIIDFDNDTNNNYYIIMDYFDGKSLDFFIKDKIIDESIFFDLFIQIIRGLSDLHSIGIIHNDIKPNNILISNLKNKNYINSVITDFGISKNIDTKLDIIAGTPFYMSPQQFQNIYTQSNDVYSLGITMFEVISGFKPFISDNIKELERKHNVENINFDVIIKNYKVMGKEIVYLIKKCSDKNEKTRYKNAGDLLVDFEKVYNKYINLKNKSIFIKLIDKLSNYLSYFFFLIAFAFLIIIIFSDELQKSINTSIFIDFILFIVAIFLKIRR